MARVTGESVLMYVDTGSTFEALGNELQCSLSRTSNVLTASDKSSSGHQGVEYGDGMATTITVSGYLDTSTSDPALNALEDAQIGENKIAVRLVVPSPYSSYEATSVVSEFSLSAANDGITEVACTVLADGAPTVTATA